MGLVLRFAASEFEAGDCFAREMDLAADEPVRPGGIEREGVAEQQDLALVVGIGAETTVGLAALSPRPGFAGRATVFGIK